MDIESLKSSSLSPYLAPGPVVMLAAFPSFFKIRITWSPPERPNGIITEYEVSYEPTDSSQPLTTTNTGLETSFTTESDLEPGMEFIFTVRASTSVGIGETASVVVSTLTRPRKKVFLAVNTVITCIITCPLPIHSCCRRSDSDCTQ